MNFQVLCICSRIVLELKPGPWVQCFNDRLPAKARAGAKLFCCCTMTRPCGISCKQPQAPAHLGCWNHQCANHQVAIHLSHTYIDASLVVSYHLVNTRCPGATPNWDSQWRGCHWQRFYGDPAQWLEQGQTSYLKPGSLHMTNPFFNHFIPSVVVGFRYKKMQTRPRRDQLVADRAYHA